MTMYRHGAPLAAEGETGTSTMLTAINFTGTLFYTQCILIGLATLAF